ncbi:F-box/LRR-repeat protein 6-like [Ornithodoros turicata]|uniref:F-box/LRR-repeat protein 6-like n=1 Tax=Ornithodoros turicata TaxID=34597 RepID=UPI00313A3BF2
MNTDINENVDRNELTREQSVKKEQHGKRKRPPMLFFAASSGDQQVWPSDDSEDSDYKPAGEPKGANRTPKSPQTIELPAPSTADDCKQQEVKSEAKSTPPDDILPINGISDYVTKKHSSKRSSKLIGAEGKAPKKHRKSHYKGALVEGSNSLKLVITKKKRKKKGEDVVKPEATPSDGLWDSKIPTHILRRIFEFVVHMEGAVPFLFRMAKVCPLWQAVVETERCLWDHVDLSWTTIQRSEPRLVRLCQDRLNHTKDLNLSGWGNSLTCRGIQAIATHCPKLSAINLSHCTKVFSDSIQILVEKCPNLKSIDLSAVSRTPSMTSPVCLSSMKTLVSKCGDQLTHLMMAENKVSGMNSILTLIAENCPNLINLDLSNVMSTTGLLFPIEKFQKGCPKLRVLLLANSYVAMAPASVVDQVQSPGFPDLEELSIAVKGMSMRTIGDNDLERLLKTSHKLRLLDARGCPNISVSGLVCIPAWDIQHLYLSNCAAARTSDVELVLRKWAHSLHVLDLSWAVNEDATNQAIMALATAENGTPIEVVELCGSAISFETIKVLLSNCPTLKKLNLQSCRSLPRGMKRVYEGEELQRFREEVKEGRFGDDSSFQ